MKYIYIYEYVVIEEKMLIFILWYYLLFFYQLNNNLLLWEEKFTCQYIREFAGCRANSIVAEAFACKKPSSSSCHHEATKYNEASSWQQTFAPQYAKSTNN